MLNDVTLSHTAAAGVQKTAAAVKPRMQESAVDRPLIEACVRGERRAQQRLYELTYSRLMNVCLRYTKDDEQARSYFVLGFLKILNNLVQYTYEGAFEPWACRVMINAVIDDLRRNKNYKQTHVHAEADQLEYRSDVAWNAFEQRANADDVMALINRLPQSTRDVFLLYGIDGYTHKEIGALLGISEGTSKWHVSEARKKLTHMLSVQSNRDKVHGKR